MFMASFQPMLGVLLSINARNARRVREGACKQMALKQWKRGRRPRGRSRPARAPLARRRAPIRSFERHPMKIMFVILLKIVIAVLAAELAAGAVHWFEDAYVREDTPILGPIM